MEDHAIVKYISIKRVQDNQFAQVDDPIIDETILKIIINNEKAFEMIFSMSEPMLLAAGFLFTQGIVLSKPDILDLKWLSQKNECHIRLDIEAFNRYTHFKTSTPVKGSSGGSLLSDSGKAVQTRICDHFQISSDQVLSLIGQHWKNSKRFQKTGALHSAAVCDPEKLLEYHEDIGRHNAVDKLAGSILLNRMDVTKKIATLSCRMSLEIIGKIIKTRIPMVISNAAPTLSAVKLAEQAGLTIIGFARDNRFNIYSHAERVNLKKSD